MGSAAMRLGIGMGRLGEAGRPRRAAEAFATLALAADAGVRLIDCPPVPEAAERLIGEVLPDGLGFRIVARAADVEGGPSAVARRLQTSLRRMKSERVHAVLARASPLAGEDGERLWTTLLKLKDQGLVERIGIAACVCDDPAALARRLRPDLMQLPLSLLDQRLLTNGSLDAVAAEGVEVHLRSVLLPGLLFLEALDGAATPISPHVSRLRRLLAEAGADPMQAALAFALSRPEASHVVVGVGSAAELRAVLKAADATGPTLDWQALQQEAACGGERMGCRAA